MVRPRPPVFVLALPALAAALMFAAACSSSPEQQLLQKYFQASRMRDNTTLANIATVSYAPTDEGTVQGFDVTDPGTEQSRELNLKMLAAAEEAARQADEEFNKKKKEYQDANLAAIDRVLEAERSNGRLRGDDLKVQEEWAKWREDTAEHAKKLTDARQALTAERSLAEISVFDARSPVDATKYDGQLITRDMTIKARIRRPDGSNEDQDLHVRLSRVELTGGPEDRPAVSGRWIITHLSEAHPGGQEPTSN